jgi:hypothetical protein
VSNKKTAEVYSEKEDYSEDVEGCVKNTEDEEDVAKVESLRKYLNTVLGACHVVEIP